MPFLPVQFRSKPGCRRSIGLAGILVLFAGDVLVAHADEQQTIIRQIQAAVAAADSPEDRPAADIRSVPRPWLRRPFETAGSNSTIAPTASEGFAALFKGAGRAQISALQTDSDDSIALQAAWREVTATVPAGRSATAVHPDRDKLVWFLRFLERRARVKAPQWWAEFLVESKAHSRDNIYPGFVSDEAWLNDHHKSGLDFVFTPRDTSLRREGDKIVLRAGTESARFPWAVFKEEPDFIPDRRRLVAVSGLIARDRCYLVIHDNSGSTHPLYCIDRPTGKTNWKAKVWGNFWGNLEGPPNVAWGSLVEADGKIFVFEASSGMNVEAFRTADGKPAFRFATSY
jgi:hypothetical protein